MSKQLKIPVLWHLDLHVIPMLTEGDSKVQVYLGGKLQFDETGPTAQTVGNAVQYIQDNFCLVHKEEAKKWMAQDECSKLVGSLSTNGNAS